MPAANPYLHRISATKYSVQLLFGGEYKKSSSKSSNTSTDANQSKSNDSPSFLLLGTHINPAHVFNGRRTGMIKDFDSNTQFHKRLNQQYSSMEGNNVGSDVFNNHYEKMEGLLKKERGGSVNSESQYAASPQCTKNLQSESGSKELQGLALYREHASTFCGLLGRIGSSTGTSSSSQSSDSSLAPYALTRNLDYGFNNKFPTSMSPGSQSDSGQNEDSSSAKSIITGVNKNDSVSATGFPSLTIPNHERFVQSDADTLAEKSDKEKVSHKEYYGFTFLL